MDATNLADLYDLPLLDWSQIQARLDEGIPQAPGSAGPNRHTCWLTTINADGSPHVTGIGALWADGSFWFETGERTRKGRNLARDPRCALSVATHDFDLVVEGTADKITDQESCERWRHGGPPKDGLPESTTLAERSLLTTALHQLDLRHGSCIA
jgi:PPOX class probable F420-dependent enzyme